MKNINILIVDDRKENLLVLESILEPLSVNIVKASSGNEALGLLFDYDFAVALLDVQMPDMDGFEVAEIMRSSERTCHIPIIFVTAISVEEEHIFKGYDSGAVDYLLKPLKDTKIILSKIKIFIELYNQKQKIIEQSLILEKKVQELEITKQELEKVNLILEQTSYFDNLTGIANRHSLEAYFNTALKNSKRERTNLSVMMIDIDRFKDFNDNYGHVQGDICLVKIAKTIKESLKRPLDFVGRYGGEEFIVLLQETNIECALKVAEEIKGNIESLQIKHRFSNVKNYVTASIGVVSLIPGKTDSINDIVIKADKALYEAKHKGRNRVVEYEED
ncbi:GGDEF domain-containing response regulator [Clostridium vincentii]|nr:diguanylate cyclase [Clostridium vincentii]